MGPPSSRASSTRRNPFVLVVTGDRRLGPEHYSAVKFRLDRLLDRHLPHVRLLSTGVAGADALAVRWAVAHQLQVERFEPHEENDAGLVRNPESQCVEWLLQRRPSGVIVFGRGGGEGSELERRARAIGAAIRTVDLRRLLARDG
jgi:YspA, cpYpsA-related SLOG family